MAVSFAFPSLGCPLREFPDWPGMAVWRVDYPDPEREAPDAFWLEIIRAGAAACDHQARVAWSRSGRLMGDVRWRFCSDDATWNPIDPFIGKNSPPELQTVAQAISWAQQQCNGIPCVLWLDPVMWKGIREDAPTDGSARHLALVISDLQSSLLGEDDRSLVDHRSPHATPPILKSQKAEVDGRQRGSSLKKFLKKWWPC